MNKVGIIYKATSPSGKVYVGQTYKTLEERMRYHRYFTSNNNNKFCKAIKKYGFEKFKWEIIEDNIPEQFLDIKECEWIQMYDAYRNGYNSTIGGNSTKGLRHSEETRKKMSIQRKGKLPWNTGKKLSDDHKEKISKNNPWKGRIPPNIKALREGNKIYMKSDRNPNYTKK